MDTIQFINDVYVKKWSGLFVLKIILFACFAFSLLSNFVIVFTSGWEELSLFSGFVVPVSLFFLAIKVPSKELSAIPVQEELQRTENGVCIQIPQIDRGDKFGEHAEQIVCNKERIKNLVFHRLENTIEIIGHPVIYFQKEQKIRVLDTAAKYEGDYSFQIHCTEENRDAILQLLQCGLERIAVKELERIAVQE